MADAAAKSTRKENSSRRRRVPGGRGPRKPAATDAAKPAETAEPRAAAPRRERTEVTPVPDSLIGTTATGTVVITIRNRRYNFGFISLACGEKAEDPAVPRVYYNPSLISEEGLKLYRGYEVQFEIAKDEENRTIAKNIHLTENGREIKLRRDAEAAAKREERAAQQPESKPAETKERAPRRPRNPKPAATAAEGGEERVRPPRKVVELTIKVQGDASKTATLSTPINGPIGRLKSQVFRAIDIEGEYSLYVVTPGNPAGEFITREVLNGLGDSATIILGPKREPEEGKK